MTQFGPRERGDKLLTPRLPQRLPLLPLVNTVVFPAGVAALKLSGVTSRRVVEALDGDGDLVALFYPDELTEDEITADDLQPIGVAARIVQTLKLDESRHQILCRGLCRIELIEVEQTEPFFTCRIRALDPPATGGEAEDAALMARAIEAYSDLAAADDRYRHESVEVLRANSAAGTDFFTDLLASLLETPLEIQRRLIETVDPRARLRYLLDLLAEEADRKAVEREVQDLVQKRVDDKKREYLLREQLKTVQIELGESHAPRGEAEQFRAMIEDLPVDDESKAILERECDALAVMSPQSAEYPAQSKYLDTVFRLPWWERTRDSLDLRKVERLLSRRHHGLGEVKERLLEYLSVIKLKGHLSGPILCLVGPPGTGKTTLARSIAEAFGRKAERISLGGISDESEIRGHRKTYIGAMPGKVISAYDKVGSCNPVLLLDELDKMVKSAHGDPAAALLEVLDPEQNKTYLDRYLGVPFDLSETLFIATANLLDGIPPALRDRLEVLVLSGYTDEEKIEIARRFMRPKLLEEHGLEPQALRFSKRALESIVRSYTAEAGVRQLERRLAAICRKVARRRATHPTKAAKTETIRAKQVPELLGPPRYQQEFAGRSPEVGVATGLAWTGEGGAILFIEASRMDGSGKVEVTGHLGEVMMESVRTAYSFVRAHARDLEIDSEIFRESDVHIHFPAGAIPKDGPSAGIAAATCLASLLSSRPVRHDVAMSGEVTLRGKLLSVGGIKEKVLAAHRARIKTVLLPIGNTKDLELIPQAVRDQLEIVLVTHVQDVWKRALVPLMIAGDREVDLIRESAAEIQRDRLTRR